MWEFCSDIITQISVTNLTDNSTTLSTHDEPTNAIGRTLANSHLPSLAEAIMDHEDLADKVFQRILDKMESEWTRLSQRLLPYSPFRRIATDEYETFEWKELIEYFTQKAPTLFYVLSSIIAHSDCWNKKVNTAHYPVLCMAVAVLLKETGRCAECNRSFLSYFILLT